MLSYLFGQFLLERELISAEQLTEGLRYQRSNNRVLGELAVELGLLDQQKVLQILEWQLSVDQDFGQVAKEMGFLDAEQLERLLELQQGRHIYLGEALVAHGALKRDELENELKLFHAEKERVLGAEGPEEELKKDTAAALFALVTKMLPRLSSGRVISGGFYPTIADPEYSWIYGQRMSGEMDFEVYLALPEELVKVLGESFSLRVRFPGKPGRKEKNARSVKEFLRRVLEIFAAKQKSAGSLLQPASEPVKINRRIYLSRKKKARKSSCAEFFLITPPGPDGEFLQFNLCLVFID